MTTPGPEFGLFLIIDALVAITAALVVYKKDPNNGLNQIVAINLVAFCLFFTFSGVIYLLAAFISVEENLFWFDQLRHASSGSAVIAAGLGILSGLYTWKGSMFIKKKTVLGAIVIFDLIALVFVVLDDHINYIRSDDYLTSTSGLVGKVGLFIIPSCFMIIAIYGFYRTMVTVEKDDPLRRRLLLLVIALVLIVFGIVYYAIIETVSSREGIMGIFGHIFYSGGCILLMYAFSARNKNSKVEI
ncbi:MAG: hypothetical protein ACXADY_18495 [Candidatus Hodarchaeales archaeon]|jgi:hypothetical protein